MHTPADEFNARSRAAKKKHTGQSCGEYLAVTFSDNGGAVFRLTGAGC